MDDSERFWTIWDDLVTILDDVLREFKFELPSHSHIELLEVDAETVRDPQAKLEVMLKGLGR